MFHATSRSSAARDAIGTKATSGARTRIASKTTIECVAQAMGDRAPDRMFVAVRASAPVAAMPPKRGATRLPMPRPTSSELGSCFVPVMPSAMTAESSDSIAPSIAMATADGTSSRTSANESECPQGHDGDGTACGIPATRTPPTTVWNRVPIVAIVNPGTRWCRSAAAQEMAPIATSGAGTRLATRGTPRRSASVAAATATSCQLADARASHIAAIFST